MFDNQEHNKILMQRRSHLLEEFKLGLIDKDEYHEQVARLDGAGPSSKRQRQSSPE